MIVVNHIRQGFYLDSVALMRLSQQFAALPGVANAALMIGSPSNKQILEEAGLLDETGKAASANDLIIALQAQDLAAAHSAWQHAEQALDQPVAARATTATGWRPRTLDAALGELSNANLTLISVPGEFAAREAFKALANDLHVMLFSDNVTLADELALKREARARGLLLMGPDCGTALIGGVPLAFANAVPRGDIGIISASGTGLQEVSCLIARAGQGVSHGIGVGGRDLGETVGGLMTLAALDILDQDARTRHIVLISKPPAPTVVDKVLQRVAASRKTFTLCFLGLDLPDLPANAASAATLQAAAEHAMEVYLMAPTLPKLSLAPGRRWLRGLYAGGTLCAEAQVVLRELGKPVASNAPLPGSPRLASDAKPGHAVLDLGADEYTVGRPHPMLDPAVRNEWLRQALADPAVAAILLDVVIGYGAHADPAGGIAAVLDQSDAERPLVIASVCGTDADPQHYSRQRRTLEQAGVIVANANAQAARIALELLRSAR